MTYKIMGGFKGGDSAEIERFTSYDEAVTAFGWYVKNLPTSGFQNVATISLECSSFPDCVAALPQDYVTVTGKDFVSEVSDAA